MRSVTFSAARLPRVRRRLRLAGAAAAAVSALLVPFAVNAATPPPSAIGAEDVFHIAVSPAYKDTGLVAVMSSNPGSNTVHLWISHNGGSTWQLAPANGWNHNKPVIAVDGNGHEILFSVASTLERSDDYGNTWTDAGGGPGAIPAVTPTFASDATLAVAGKAAGGKPDYAWHHGSASDVAGSGGAYTDFSFNYSPNFPSGGRGAPALLNAMDKNGLPIIQRCNAALTCSGAATLPGAVTFSAPTALYPSSTFSTDGVVFAQSGRGIYKSLDGATTFTAVPIVQTNGAAQATPGLALQPGYTEGGPIRTLFASVLAVYTDPKNPHSTGGVYRSDDGGTTWAKTASSPLDGGSNALAIAPDGRLFAGYLGSSQAGSALGLLCSPDGGASWRSSCPSVGHYQPGTTPVVKPSVKASACPSAGCSPVAVASAAAASPSATGTAATGGSGGGAGGVGHVGSAASSRGAGPLPGVALAVVLAAAAGGAFYWLYWRRRGSAAG